MKKFLFVLMSLFIVNTVFSTQSLQTIRKTMDREVLGLNRISINTFTTSQKKFSQKSEIGEYLADQLAIALFKSKKIKLYERSKLKSILKEHQLLMSGVIDEDDVVKLGELAPIDAILFGSYLKMKNSVEITLRLVSVSSGEIEWTSSQKVPLTEELDALFNDKPPVKKLSDEEKAGIIKKKIKTITSQDDIDQITHLAKQIPFTSPAGEINKQIIQEYHKMKIYDPAYAEFLSQELQKIEKILNETIFTRCTHVLHYIKKVDGLSPEEEELALQVLRKWNNAQYGDTFVEFFFDIEKSEKSISQRKKDIDRFLQMHKEGKLEPISYLTIFIKLSYLFHTRNVNSEFRDNNLSLYVVEKMYPNLEDQGTRQILGKLKTLYVYTKEPKIKDQFFLYYCDCLNRQKVNYSLANALATTMKNLEKAAQGKDKKNEFRKSDIPVFFKQCGKLITRAMSEQKNNTDEARWKNWKAMYERNGLKIPD